MIRRVACLLVLSAALGCGSGSDRSERPPPELVATLPDVAGALTATETTIYVSTWAAEILAVPKAGGEPTLFLADQPTSQLKVHGGFLYWVNTLSSLDGNRHELARSALESPTVELLAPGPIAVSFAVDEAALYWATNDGAPGGSPAIYRVSLGGGTPALWLSSALLERAGPIALDEMRVYVANNETNSDKLLAAEKADAAVSVLVDGNLAGTGGVGEMLLSGESFYLITSTGGGMYSHTVKVVAKAGGSVEPLGNAGCDSMLGLAVDGDQIYLSCTLEFQPLVQRIAASGGQPLTLAEIVQPEGETHLPTAPVVDATHVYFAAGKELYRVPK